MKNKWKLSLASVALSVSLLGPGLAVYAADGALPVLAAAAGPSVKLNDVLDAELKSVLNQKTENGTRLGVVVRLKNTGSALTRVPDYEVRVETADGIQYTLKPSAANARSLQAKSSTELSYLADIDRMDDVTVTQVNWTDVDYYVYPKTETVVASIPVQAEVWQGENSVIAKPEALKKWSDSFRIPGLTSPIQYTPVSISKESAAAGTVYVVQLLAYNPSERREAVPAFSLDGKADSKVFAGSRVEQGALALEPGAEKYIHYAIPVDQDTVLQSLNLLTSETFAEAGAAGVSLTSYAVGRLHILLPGEGERTKATIYALGTPVVFDGKSQLVNPEMKVSVEEFYMHANKEEGNKGVTATFKLTNTSKKPLAVPAFAADLVTKEGYEYAGSRQAIQTAMVLPGSSVTVRYAFTVPASEKGEDLILKVQDAVSAAPYKTTIAALSTGLLKTENNRWNLYPYDVKVSSWILQWNYGVATNYNYVYRLKLDLSIERDQAVQVDNAFSRIMVELYDSYDRLVGTGGANIYGQERLVNGDNIISIQGASNMLDVKHKIYIYEVFNTPSGEAKRLLAQYNE
ncbi:hypothetical protein [Paenibacillus sp. YN15]|uniref:hypothetical protein n=1 Tax=Paenibacillus sp. YN15 TaxID=1742774 RepID=UPI000DCD4CB3|nr:hypothetical protein [Paenibacillus sp. YN15]RAV04661.1 hypothetical protein DQG13_05460 [Paenibacillus sp. YN15]